VKVFLSSIFSATSQHRNLRLCFCLLAMAVSLWFATSAVAFEKVTLQLKWFHQFQFAGFYAARAQGYYREAGLEVNFLEVTPNKMVIDSVLDGTAQYGVDDSRLLVARADDKPVVALGAIFQHSSAILLARQESPAQNIHDLIGKRIMLEENRDDIAAYLLSEGLSADKYSQVSHSFNLQDLIDGKVDAISAYLTNEPFYLNQMGFKFLAFSPRSAGIDFYGDTLFTTDQELKNHPDRVEAFREASFRGWKYAMAHPEELADLILADYSQRKSREDLLFEAHQMALLIQPDLVEMGYMNPGRWRHIAETYTDLGLLSHDFSLDGFLYEPDKKIDHTHIIILAAVLAFGLMIAVATVLLLRKVVRLRTEDLNNANRVLAKQSNRLASIINGTTDAVYIKDTTGKYVIVNDEVVRLFGRPRVEILGRDDSHFLPPEEAQQLMDSDRAIMEGAQVVTKEEAVTTLGRLRVFLATKGPVYDELGKAVGVFGISRDMTESKRQEAALRASNDKFESLVANTPGHIAYVNADTLHYEFVNEQFEKSFGIPRGKIIGSHIKEIIGEENYRHALKYIDIVRSGKSISYENTFSLVSGKRWIRVNYAPIFGENGRVASIVVLSYDITERKQAEESLWNEKAFLRSLIDSAEDLIYFKDQNSTYLGCNKASEIFTGLAEAEQIGKTDFDFFDREFAEQIVRQDQMVLAGGTSIRVEEWVNAPTSGRRLLETVKAPIYGSEGQPIGLVGISRDVTDRNRVEKEKLDLEQQLQQVHKLESLGVLAGGIAHDFNNILAGVYGNVSLARAKLSKDQPDHPAFRYLSAAEESMNRATLLSGQLLTFAKGGDPVKENLSIINLMNETVHFNLSGSNVKPVITLAENLWFAKGDRGQLQQVFSNLTINAKQAMPDGGHLSISVENVEIAKNTVPDLDAGKYLLLTVADNGIGITPEHLERIFDPYFSTKQTGSGLGLATVYSIIKKHGGHVSAASQPGKGTIFTLYLPASEAKEQVINKTDPVLGTFKQTAKILVMDDEELIRSTVSALLEELNYIVETAAEGRQALSLYQQALTAGKPFDLVILDLTIPGGVGGKEVAQRILKVDPGAKMVVSSGYADDPVMANHREYGFKGVIAKPYNLNTLAKLLPRVLGAR